ncbi:MAG: sigma-70 family RNA polymerase sigma factor [Fimbriimonadaceae bacterium]|nr:sigma-70 family RNA polymerase sigma factor [Fimbriimonadaceae bacterium]
MTKPSFSAIVDRELATLYRVARRLARRAEDAEDLVGTTLLLAAKAWERFDGAYPRSWLIRIMRNEYYHQYGKQKAAPMMVTEGFAEPSEEGFWQAIDWKLVGSEITAAIDALPDDFRMALVLCDVEEMSYQEVADALDVPIGTVRSRLFRARRLLRASLVNLGMNEQEEANHD